VRLFELFSRTPRPARRLLRALRSAEEARVILEPIVEPVVLRLNPIKTPAGLAVARDDDVSASRRNATVVLHFDNGTCSLRISVLFQHA